MTPTKKASIPLATMRLGADDRRRAIRPKRHPATKDANFHGQSYTAEELAFIKAVNTFRQFNHIKIMSCCEYLAVLKAMGYRLVDVPIPVIFALDPQAAPAEML
jgi:hypothetical protein